MQQDIACKQIPKCGKGGIIQIETLSFTISTRLLKPFWHKGCLSFQWMQRSRNWWVNSKIQGRNGNRNSNLLKSMFMIFRIMSRTCSRRFCGRGSMGISRLSVDHSSGVTCGVISKFDHGIIIGASSKASTLSVARMCE